jgi:MFS family permease
MATALFIASPLGGALSGRFGSRYVVATGIAIATFGIYLFSGLDPKTTQLELAIPLFVFAMGLGLGMAPMTAAATNSVPAHEVGVSSAVLNLVRNIAGAVGIAFFGTILTSSTEANVLSIAASSTLHSTEPTAQAMFITLITLKAQIEAYAHVFVIAAMVMSTGVLLSLFLRDPAHPEDPARTEAALPHAG